MKSSFPALGLAAWAQLEAKAGHTLWWGAQGTAISLQPLLELFLQSHLNLGMFTVSPCSGSIGPWGQQKITVDCFAGQEGKCEEQLYIDIPGRDPKENPLGVPFTLIAESCLPGTYWPQCPWSHLLLSSTSVPQCRIIPTSSRHRQHGWAAPRKLPNPGCSCRARPLYGCCGLQTVPG